METEGMWIEYESDDHCKGQLAIERLRQFGNREIIDE